MEINEFDFLDDIVEQQEKNLAAAETQEENTSEETTNNEAQEETESNEEQDEEASSEGDSDYYSKYYDFLKEQGAIQTPDDFKFEPTEEGFSKAVEATKELNYKNALQEVWEALPPTGRPLIEYFLAGGTDVNKYIQAYTDINLDALDLEEEDNQLRVLRQYYTEVSNYSPEKINKLLTRLQAKDGLKEEALDAIEELKEHKAELQANLVKQAEAEKQALKVRADKERSLLVSAIKEAESTKQSKIEAMLFNPVRYEDSVTTEFNYYLNKISSNPKHLVQLADLLSDYSPEKGFNLERFENRVVTNKTKSLKALIDSKIDPRKNTSSGSTTNKVETFPFDKFLS